MTRHHIDSVSGGKDSTAMYLHDVEAGLPFRAVMADTGNEHPATLEYAAALGSRTGGPEVEIIRPDFSGDFAERRRNIRRKWPKEGVPAELVDQAVEHMVPSGNPFLDLCLLRGGCPSWNHRFCTEHLKIRPIHEKVNAPLWLNGDTVVSRQGVRAQESAARADLPRRQTLQMPNPPEGAGAWPEGAAYEVERPLIDWTIEDVWRMHRRHGLEPNKLYAQGFTRVGCMSCIYASKADLVAMGRFAPEHVDRWESWEHLLSLVVKSRNSIATLIPIKAHTRDFKAAKARGLSLKKHGIRAAVRWANNGHDPGDHLFADDSGPLRQDLMTHCGEWGACE